MDNACAEKIEKEFSFQSLSVENNLLIFRPLFQKLGIGEKALSILIAKRASFIFLSKVTSELNKKFFATCWVIVDAPTNLFPFP